MNTIRGHAADDAHVIYGTACDETLGDPLRVTVIATGLSPARKAAITPPQLVVPQLVAQPVQASASWPASTSAKNATVTAWPACMRWVGRSPPLVAWAKRRVGLALCLPPSRLSRCCLYEGLPHDR